MLVLWVVRIVWKALSCSVWLASQSKVGVKLSPKWQGSPDIGSYCVFPSSRSLPLLQGVYLWAKACVWMSFPTVYLCMVLSSQAGFGAYLDLYWSSVQAMFPHACDSVYSLSVLCGGWLSTSTLQCILIHSHGYHFSIVSARIFSHIIAIPKCMV